jgi:hypothetical protein
MAVGPGPGDNGTLFVNATFPFVSTPLNVAVTPLMVTLTRFVSVANPSSIFALT